MVLRQERNNCCCKDAVWKNVLKERYEARLEPQLATLKYYYRSIIPVGIVAYAFTLLWDRFYAFDGRKSCI